jgi:hypothetical protein
VIPFNPQVLSAAKRRLLKRFESLGEQDRDTLLAFADFLASRGDASGAEASSPDPERPKEISRPEKESVVAAIRRLSETYFMLERQSMLNETASLMAAHVIQGRAARDVVDELESVFAARYQEYLKDWQS